MRNISFPALILNIQPSGENNRNVMIFSAEEGISYATLYGGPKSKLRSLVSPMNSGIIYLYRDESKNQTKITDFDVKNYHLSFRENLFKTWAANLASEILIRTKCAGSSEASWKIVRGFLDGMEISSEAESRLGLVRFLWRYLDLLGVKPDTKFCCQCGESLHAGKFTNHALSYRYPFQTSENGFVCPDCGAAQVHSESNSNPFSAGIGKAALTYLEATSSLSPKEVRAITIDLTCLQEMKTLVYFLIEQACGSKLKTLETGIGIL
ncbi:MAG: DNA repair protein RecO C-terminal domain-containing protein [Treponema sp.]|nr:DNA repair protein RecO C-terminal domain-containing protein [Candidatus Treponema equifaecale]